MSDNYVKCWVFDKDLTRVQTRWVPFGTKVQRFYGRYATERYVHDLTWDSEKRLAEKANEFYDFYFFSGDKEHINRDLFMEHLPDMIYNKVDWNIELDNTNPAGLFRIEGLVFGGDR